MPDITVTIPTNKVALAKLAVLHHSGETDMTNAEMIAWIQARWIEDLRAMSRKQQDAEFDVAKTYQTLD